MEFEKEVCIGNDCMKWSSDRETWYHELDLCANDYNVGFGCWFGDSKFGLWKELWISREGVGFCYGMGGVEK